MGDLTPGRSPYSATAVTSSFSSAVFGSDSDRISATARPAGSLDRGVDRQPPGLGEETRNGATDRGGLLGIADQRRDHQGGSSAVDLPQLVRRRLLFLGGFCKEALVQPTVLAA